jgi:hypothetical protein
MRERKKDRLDKKTISEMKRDLKDADITIKNNSIFEVVLRSDKNGGSYISLKPTEEEDITFSDLQSIVKKQKSLFEDFSVLIEDVYCPDNENIGIEELEQIVGLGRIKKGMEEIPDEEYFDDLLSADCSVDEFFYEVDKMKIQVINRLIERAIYLYKEKEFSNNFKMSYLEKKLGVQNVFDDIDRSMKKIQSDVDRL